mgnify:CR=1 FL=1
MFVVVGGCTCDRVSFPVLFLCCFFLIIRRPPRSTQSRSSAASDVYKRQAVRAVNSVQGQANSVEEIIRLVLRGMDKTK